jgi:hypothetical protein
MQGLASELCFAEIKKAPQVGRFERESEWHKFTVNFIKSRVIFDEEIGSEDRPLRCGELIGPLRWELRVGGSGLRLGIRCTG